jgi:hypothetical protein
VDQRRDHGRGGRNWRRPLSDVEYGFWMVCDRGIRALVGAGSKSSQLLRRRLTGEPNTSSSLDHGGR